MKKNTISVVCAAMAVGATLNAQQPHNSNPWGLVYADAITENRAGEVNIHPLTYDLGGLKIAANVYTPAGYDPARSYPAQHRQAGPPHRGHTPRGRHTAAISRRGCLAPWYPRYLRRRGVYLEGRADR